MFLESRISTSGKLNSHFSKNDDVIIYNSPHFNLDLHTDFFRFLFLNAVVNIKAFKKKLSLTVNSQPAVSLGKYQPQASVLVIQEQNKCNLRYFLRLVREITNPWVLNFQTCWLLCEQYFLF